MISRRLIFEISVALLVFGCVLLFNDQRSESKAWSEVGQAVVARNQALERFQSLQSNLTLNCSQFAINQANPATAVGVNATTTIRVLNSSGSVVSYVINMTAACAQTATTFLVPKTTETVQYSSYSRSYVVVLNIDCVYGAQAIKEQMASWAGVSSSQIVVLSYTCGSVTMSYQCNAPTTSEAESTCDSITKAACSSSSTLYSFAHGTSCGLQPESSSGSSTSLYGLFALCAIPILLCGLLIIWYRNSQREADNQYTQDTATFSNVATSPQPIGVPQNTPTDATYVSQTVPMAYGSPAYQPVTAQPQPGYGYGAPLQ